MGGTATCCMIAAWKCACRQAQTCFWSGTILAEALRENLAILCMTFANLSRARNLPWRWTKALVLQELVVEKMPKLAEHLSALQCDITIVATDWFLCLFCTTLPSEVRRRAADILQPIKLARRAGTYLCNHGRCRV